MCLPCCRKCCKRNCLCCFPISDIVEPESPPPVQNNNVNMIELARNDSVPNDFRPNNNNLMGPDV